MSFVKLLEDVTGMMSMNIHLKGLLYFRGGFDLYSKLLWISGMMCRMGLDLSLDQYIAKHLQYLHPLVTFWICVLIFDAIIPKKLYFWVFAFCGFEFYFILPNSTT